MSDRYFEVTPNDHRVVNCILWDGITEYTPPGGMYLIKDGTITGMRLGWQKIDGIWTAPIVEEVAIRLVEDNGN